MKKFLLSILAALMTFSVYAADDFQAPNSNFEDWSGPTFKGEAQPKDWHASNVEQVGMQFNFAHKEAGHNGGSAMMVQDQSVGALGITETSPGYFSLGQPWAYLPSVTQINQATAGTYGGISFTHRPDSMVVWIKRTGDNTDKEDFYLLFYSWAGTAKGTKYKGKNGNCTSVSYTDEESDIRLELNGNECGTTTKANPGQIAEGMWREKKTYGNWTRMSVPIYYFNDNVPQKMNIIFSASNYPNYRANNGLYVGNSLYVDDLELIYSSKIQELRIGGKRWNGFDPYNTEVQTYSLGETATQIPSIEARRGVGSITNAAGKTVPFNGRVLSGSEISIEYGDLDKKPTVITVHSEDGKSTTTYKIQFQKAASSNAKLAGLSYVLDGDTTAIADFAPAKYSYEVELPYGTKSIPSVGYIFAEDGQTATVTQPASTTGTATIKTLAPNKVGTATYTITFTVGKLKDNTLADILINGKSVTGFTPSQTIYKVSLPVGTTTLKVEPKSAYAAGEQAIVVSPNPLPSGDAINGSTVQIEVTAPGNANKKTYKLNIKIEASSYSYLANLQVVGDQIEKVNPAKAGNITALDFAPDNMTYYVNLKMGTTELPNILWTPGDEYQTITKEEGGIDGTTRITVLAGNKSDQSVYKLVFNTAKSEISTLAGIKIGGVAIPDFRADSTTYTYSLPVGSTELPTIEPIAGDEFQNIAITYGGVNGKTRIVVTAGNGNTTIYVITFSVATFTDNTLAAIYLDGELIDGFDSEKEEYYVNLPQGTTALPVVTYDLKDPNFQTASVRTISGLNGDYRITVRPANGASRTYVIHFSVATSSNTNLNMIYIDGVAIEGFRPDSTDYKYDLPEGVSQIPTVTYDKAEESQRVLSVLENKVQIITVTAQSGARKEYTITFNVQVSKNASLEMIYLDGVPLADFNKETLEYTVQQTGATCPVITVDKAAGQQVTITAPYAAGDAIIKVLPEQGAANTYTIHFVAVAAETVRLKGIAINGTPIDFDPLTMTYNAQYENELPEVTAILEDAEAQSAKVLWKDTVAWIHVQDTLGNKASYSVIFTHKLSSNNTLLGIYADGVLINGFAVDNLTYAYELEPGSAYPEISYKVAENAQVVFFGQIAKGKWGVTVVAENGSRATYTVAYTIKKYSDATLADLRVDGVTIENFSPTTFVYNRSIDEGATLPKVSVEKRPGQTILQYQADASHQQVIVFAEDGSANTYYINYARVPSNNALLADILIDGVSIEGFDPNIEDYIDSLAWRTTVIPNVFPVAQLPNQTITTYYSSPNGITKIHVESQDGTTKDYSVAFPVRKSDNTKLGDLYLDSEDAEIKFKEDTLNYTVIIPYESIECPKMVYGKAEPEQRIDVISRAIGDTSKIIVTAENGDTRTYNILFKREVLKTKNLLSVIRIKELDTELSLKNKDQRDFNVTMPFGSRSLTVEYEKSYPEQTVFIQPGGVHAPTIITVKANNDTVADEIYTINPIVPTADPAVLTDIKVNGATIDGFDPEHFSYIVKVTDKPILRYTLNKGAEINILDQTSKHWKAEVTYGARTNTYEVWYYYQNDIIPNANLDDWSAKTKYNDKNKPKGWNVIADADDAYSTIIGTDRTGEECQKASDGSAYLPTTYRARCCRNVPAFMALGTISGTLNTQNAFTYSGGIVFRNSPDYLSIRYKAPVVHNHNHLIYILQGTEGEFTIDSTDTKSFDNYKVKTLDLRGANEAAGEPTLLNIVLNSYSGTTGDLGSEGMFGSISEMYVDWLQFSFNHTLTSMKANGLAATKSGNAFEVTLDNSEYIEKPILSFTGEVADQAQDVVWAAPTKDANFETRTADIRNWAENGADYTDYTLTVRRPLDTKNQLADLLLDNLTITGFNPATTAYTVHMPAARHHMNDIVPVPASSLQTVTTAFNEADSTMTITVTPEKGDATVYTVKFVTDLSDDTTLKNISADGITFDADTRTYEVTAERLPLIFFEKNSDSQKVSLINGVLTVTAEDGNTTGTYTINRLDPVITPNGTISEFELKGNVLNDFGGTTYEKEAAKPTDYITFTRAQVTDSVIFVQAPDKMTWAVPETSMIYTWTYPIDLSSDATLRMIRVNGEDYEEFTPGEGEYDITSDTAIIVETIPAREGQTLATTVEETEGGVTYTTTVTPEDGSTPKTYRVSVRRSVSSLSTLAGIMLDSVMIEGFDPNTLSYIVTLPTPAVKVAQPLMPSVTFVAGDEKQTVTVTPGELNGEATKFVVMAEDGISTDEYDLTINAEPSHCSDLTGITVNGVALDHFEPGRHFYSLSVKTEDIGVDYTADDRFLKVDTIIEVVKEHHEYHYTLHVTAEDGSTSDYLVEIYVENQSSDAQLANITLGKERIDFVNFLRDINPDIKPFDPGLNNYDINLPSGTTVLPEVSAQLKMDGQVVEIEQYGIDSIALDVTADDGVTKNRYVLNFHIPLSKNANLGMIYYDGEPVPGFDPLYYFYQINLPVGQYTMPKVDWQKGEGAQLVDSVVDLNKLQVSLTVSAEDPTSQNTYVLLFHFTASDADTLNMIYEDGSQLGGYQPRTFYYARPLPVGTTAFPDLFWEEADEWQTIKLDTAEFIPEDKLVRQITVVAASGKKNTYTVAYNILKSDVDTLQNLYVDQKALADFAPRKMEYYYTISASYAVELNGQLPVVEYTSGDDYQNVLVSQAVDSLSGKSLGYKSVVSVTAASGKSRTYTIHYPVELSSENALNMILLGGKPLVNYDAERLNYKVEIPLGGSVPVISVIKKEEAQTYEIRVMEDTVQIDVWAEDLSSRTYKLTFDRIKSSIATLANIIITDEAGKQLPYEIFDYNPGTTDYEIVLPYDPNKTGLVLPNIKTILGDSVQVVTMTEEKLSDFSSTVTIHVLAQDGINETHYVLTFIQTRNNDALLADVLLDGVSLEGFDANNTDDYTYVHPFGSDSAVFFTLSQITAIPHDPKATVTVEVDENGKIVIKVIAQDEVATLTYIINQEIGKDSDNKLKTITVNDIEIRDFDPDETDYTYFLQNGATALPILDAEPNSPNATYVITPGLVGDTTYIYCTAQDGSERVYRVLFMASKVNDALEASGNDVIIKRLPGTNTLFVGTIRKDVHFALYDRNGHILVYEHLKPADPNDIVMADDLETSERLTDIVDSRSGKEIEVIPEQVYFYTFFYGEKDFVQMMKRDDAKRLKSGKLILTR